MVSSYLHDYFLRSETAICFDFKIELVGLSVVVKGFVVTSRFFFACIFAERPFVLDILFVPISGMAEFVVGIVFEGDSRAWRPFSVFFGDALKEVVSMV